MSLAQDLMGLGVSPLQAAHTATGGTGPLTINAAGTTFATGTKLGVFQYLVSCINSTITTGIVISLPTVGSDNGALLADDYIINNASTTTITVFASSGVAISVAASNTNSTALPIHTTMTLYPVSTTQWIGVKGT